MKFKVKKQGQQLVEYLLLFAMIIIVLMIFVRPNGSFRRTVNQTLEMTIDKINKEANKI